mmetsp:Transcript_17608/g.48820  ORF Transcript_17608/g.48820 Transcript_17608/m.48820 type:complete len:121 (+) Transcript_17608:1075-1437(+)
MVDGGHLPLPCPVEYCSVTTPRKFESACVAAGASPPAKTTGRRMCKEQTQWSEHNNHVFGQSDGTICFQRKPVSRAALIAGPKDEASKVNRSSLSLGLESSGPSRANRSFEYLKEQNKSN